MAPPKGVCRGCGELIGSGERAAYAVTGFEQERVGGGANHIVERKRIDGELWHDRHSADCFALRDRQQSSRTLSTLTAP